VIEGLACGRPALVSDTCGIADLIQQWGAGTVAPRRLEDLRDALDVLRSGYDAASRRARELAQAEFDRSMAVRRYEAIYRKLALAGR